MDNYIKEIWQVFKKENKERFYLFYEEKGLLCHRKISKNETVNSGEIDLSLLTKIAPLLNGKSVIAVHNHPNDKPTPSYPDFVQKEYLESLLRLINVTVKDYVIVSTYGFVSFVDSKKHKFVLHQQLKGNDIIEEVSLPNLLLSSSVLKHQDKIKSLLKKHSEVIYTPSQQFASNFFPGQFFLAREVDLLSKSIFFCSHDNSDSLMKRLQDINESIEPNEIYYLDKTDLIPLKKNGML